MADQSTISLFWNAFIGYSYLFLLNGGVFVTILAIIPSKEYQLMSKKRFVFYVTNWLLTTISSFEMIFSGIGFGGKNYLYLWFIYFAFLMLSIVWFYLHYRSDYEKQAEFLGLIMFLLGFVIWISALYITIEGTKLIFTMLTFIIEAYWGVSILMGKSFLNPNFGKSDVEVPIDPKLALNNSNAPQDTTKLDDALAFINREGIEKCTFDQ